MKNKILLQVLAGALIIPLLVLTAVTIAQAETKAYVSATTGNPYPPEKSKAEDIQRAKEYENRKQAGIWKREDLVYGVKRALPNDTDNDGMPDTWEDAHGLNKNNPGDAWLDPDGDMVVNLFEYQLNSGPADPNTPPFVTVTSAGALENALDNVSPGTNIKVAGGTYYINYITRSEKIIMIQGGWKSDFSQRDLSKYPTTLDGNMEDEILYFSIGSGQPIIILDGLHFVRGAGHFGALNLLAKETTFMRTSILNCSFAESSGSSYGAVLRMNNWHSSESDRTIANTLITGNLASGIYAQITEGTQSRWRIINTTIADNQNGGGDNGYGIESFTLA